MLGYGLVSQQLDRWMTSVKTMFESLLLTGINGTEYGFGITNLIAVMQIEMHSKCLWIRWNLLIYCTERSIRRKIRYGSFCFLNRDYYPLSPLPGVFYGW